MMAFGFNVSQQDAQKLMDHQDDDGDDLHQFLGGGEPSSGKNTQEYQAPPMYNFNATGPTLAPQNIQFNSSPGAGGMMYQQ